jgi:FdhE protein
MVSQSDGRKPMSIESSAGLRAMTDETVPVILPAPATVFEKRAARLHSLAPGHAIGEFLEAMAMLVDAQRVASQSPFLEKERFADRVLPFNLRDRGYGESGRKILEVIISEMQTAPLPEPSHAALSHLNAMTDAGMESSATAILSGHIEGVDLAAAPFLAAALQVYWTGVASKVRAGAEERSIRHCPICSSPPVAGMILSARKLRYLCCSLCSTHWYVPRLTCSQCGSTAGLSYFKIDGAADGIKAEACSQCNTYLKLFYLENSPEAEAFSDDLATLTLDFMMADGGYSRSGINLFLLAEQEGTKHLGIR